MTDFTTIKFEAFVNGAWVDITPDVLQSPPPQVSGMGILGNSIMDRVGSNGTMTFSLDNSTGNSAGTLGYYTPDGANVRAGFSSPTGLPIHLYFEWNGIRRYKFFGLIEPGGYKVVAGKYSKRRVDVRCSNWMKLASDHQLNLLGYQLSKRFDQGIQLVINNMSRPPQAYLIRPGNETFTTLFDITRTDTRALGEIQKLTMSEFGRAYVTGDGQTGECFTLENRQYRTVEHVSASGDNIPVPMSDATTHILLMSGDDLLLMGGGFVLRHEVQEASFTDADFTAFVPSYGENMANRVTFRTFPRTVDAAATTVLWQTDERIALAAGEERNDVRGTFRDPDNPDVEINGIELVTPVATTDYTATENEDGTGTDYTSSLTLVADISGTAEVKYTKLLNGAGVTVYVHIQQRGKAVRIYSPNEQTYNFTTSDWQAKAGVLPLDIDLPYLNNIDGLYVEELGSIWGTFLLGVAVPGPRVKSITLSANKNSKCMAAFMSLEPGMTMKISETVTQEDSGLYENIAWFVNGYDFTIKSGKLVEWRVVLQPTGYAQ